MPDPAWRLRRAPRPDPPVVCPGFGVDRFQPRVFVPPPVYIGIPLFVLVQEHSVNLLWLGEQKCQECSRRVRRVLGHQGDPKGISIGGV